jgi:hypothetical protein
MFIQGNNITGTFPKELCPQALSLDGLALFGVDCAKIGCDPNCCQEYNCFYLEKTAYQ